MSHDRKQLQRLSLEIKDFVQYLSPTRAERNGRDRIFEECKGIVTDLIPNCEVVPFGSYETGLLLPTSDVDLRIAFKDEESNLNPRPVLRRLYKKLVKRFGYQNVELIFAKVPVIKVDFKSRSEDPIHVDISVGNSSPSSDRTLAWMNKFSELKSIYLFLKTVLLSVRLVDDPKYEIMSARMSGMAGYTLVCMIVHYIQNTVIPENEDRTSPAYLGKFLLDFLKFYSTWDYRTQQMIMDEVPGFIPKPHPIKTGILQIRDPDDSAVNVARSTTTMDRVQGVFGWISREIQANMKKETILKPLVSPDWRFGARDRYTSYSPRVLRLSAADIGFKITKIAKDYNAQSNNNNTNDTWNRKRPRYEDRDAVDGDFYPRKRQHYVRRKY